MANLFDIFNYSKIPRSKDYNRPYKNTEVQILHLNIMADTLMVIQSFETSAKNYMIAWESLNERYDNKRILVQNHTKTIFVPLEDERHVPFLK